MSLQDIIITGSISSIATQSYGQRTYIASSDEESIPLENIDGSDGKVWPNFVEDTNYTNNLVINVTQSWSGSNTTPLGIVPYIHNSMDEFINGEFSGSNYVVSDGNLTDLDCQQLLDVSTVLIGYSMFPYTELNSFLNIYTIPRNGEFLMYYEPSGINDKTIKYLKISRIDKEGNNNTISLQELKKLIWVDNTVGKIILNIINIVEYPTYYYYEVTPKTYTTPYFADDNVLDYTLHATSSVTSIPSRTYIYLTSSWNAFFDSASGFSNGKYIYPLTPNCNIYYTASINLTVQTATTFSWAINGYDPSSSININNAVSSMYFPLNFTGSNLNAGTYTLIISGSGNAPIQSYIYEIDAYVNNNELLPNAYLTGTGGNPADIPDKWRCSETSSINVGSTTAWRSFQADFPLGLLDNYPGGVYLQDTNAEECMLRTDQADFQFNVGDTYNIQIEIPYPGMYAQQTDKIFGPPSVPLTCSVNRNSISTSVIGYIPSGAYGTFNFTHKMGAGERDICIITPTGASVFTGTIYNLAAIGKVSAQITSSVVVNNLSWHITQSQQPQLSTSSIVIEPYLYNTFNNSDCDVLMNNYSENDYSKKVHRVLYENGGTIPSNLQQIISGTAEYAEVNDYLYNAHANTLPRYAGVRTTSPNFNLPSNNGYGQLANVESLQTYFAYYDYVTSSYAELLNKSLIHIKYLIDIDGNVFTPALSSSYYYNLIDNFETGKNVNISLNGLDNISIIGLKKVLRPGALLWGIIASQTGSGFNMATTMSFSNNSSTTLVPNYASLINGTSPYQNFPIISGGSTTIIDLSSTAYVGAETTVNTAGNYVKVDSTSNNVVLNFKLTGQASLSNQYNNPPSNNVTATIYLQESTDAGVSWSNIDSKSLPLTYGITSAVNLVFNNFTPIIDNRYRVILYHGSGYFSINIANLKLSLTQDPVPTQAGEVTSSYWSVGSISKNILTGSQFLKLYNSYNVHQLNYADSGSGYKNFLNFNIKPADEIRFEGDENQVYSIYNVTSDDNALYLELNKDIVTGTDINSFLIRRYEPNPNFITVDWDGTGYINGNGFLFPEYYSNDLKQNFDKIITNLKEKGLI